MNTINVIDIQIERLFKDEVRIGKIQQALDLLEQSGVFPIMQRIGTPTLYKLGADPHLMASQGNWSNGYQSCLDHLRYFVRLFEPKTKVDDAIGQPDFGGDAAAVAKGILKEEDLK